MLTGERDPLCDDTAIFEGRLLSAHEHKFQTRKDLGLIRDSVEFDEKKHVEVEFIPGVSHGFLQSPLCTTWLGIHREMQQMDEESLRRFSGARDKGQTLRCRGGLFRCQETHKSLDAAAVQ